MRKKNQILRKDIFALLTLAFICTAYQVRADEPPTMINYKNVELENIKHIEVEVYWQQTTVNGTVTDNAGIPLPGATILEKGTTNGVISDFDGNYSIQVSEDAILEVSFIGYSTKEVAVNGRSEIDIVMESELGALDEVLVVGYGSQKKTDVTGSVASVSSDKLLEQPSVSPIEALNGKVAGVSVFNGSGRPGGDFRVKIRGSGSINASNDPLYVIDGFVGADVNLINTNDIESMSVLKDASATAIYGAQGANGVVIITTKKAKRGKLNLSYSGSFGISKQANKVDVLDANQFMEMRNRLYDDIRKYRPSEADNLVDYANDYPNLFNPDGSPIYNTNWQDEVLRTAYSNRHYISISGASDKINSGLSIGYQDEEGIMKTTYLKKLTARFFGEYRINEAIKFGGDFSYGYTKQNRLDDYRVGGLTPTRAMIEFPPILPVTNSDGTYSNSDDILRKNGAWDIYYGVNPVGLLNRMERVFLDYQALGNFYIDLQLSKNFKFKTSYGRQLRISNNREYVDRDWDTYVNMNQADLGQRSNDNQQFENLLTYSNKFKNHNIDVLLGASWYRYNTFSWSASASNFSDEFYQYYNIGLGTNPPNVGSSETSSTLNSYFGRLNYSFKNKYMVTATARYDGSSRFGSNNRYAMFPSFAAAWKVGEEEFLNQSKVISNLKLRASWGKTGNNAIGDYLAIGSPSTQIVIFNNDKAIGTTQGTVPNNDLKWEQTAETNFGVDVGFFDRISLTGNYYIRKTNNLLFNQPLPIFTGYSSALTNIGSTENKGIELALDTKNIISENFSWNTTVTFSKNKSIVKSLGANNADLFINVPSYFNTNIMRVGEELASFWGYTRIGTWDIDEADEAAKYNLVPGDVKLKDVNGDYKYDIKDRGIIGNASRDYEMNINNTLVYKNWDLTFDIQVSQGADVVDASYIFINDRYNYANGYTKFYNQAWTPENQNTMRPRVRPNLDRFDALDSGQVFDGSFIRGRNIMLGYNFNSDLLGKLNLTKLRLYASAQNFFLITDYHSFDPEVASWGNQFGQGIELNGYPKAIVFNTGLKVTF